MSDQTPSGWTWKRLGDISSTRRGISYTSDQLGEVSQSVPLYINMKSFRKDGGYNKDGEKYFNSSFREIDLLHPDDLLIVNTDVTPSGDILGVPLLIPHKYLHEKVLYSHHVTSLRLNDFVRKEYLYYLLCHPKIRQEMKTHGRGTTVKMLDSRDFLDIVLHIPPKEEQIKIVAILSSIDALIDRLKEFIGKLQNVRLATIDTLFELGIRHNERPPSSVNKLPSSWRLVELSDISTKIGDGLHSTPQYVENSDYFFVNGNNLVNGSLVVFPNTKMISEAEYMKYKINLSDRSILMSINGTIGNLAFFNGEKVVLGKSAAYISLKESVSKDFVYYYLSSRKAQQYFKGELTGSTINNLSLKAIRATPIPIPSMDEQLKISEIIASIDDRLNLSMTKLKKLTDLKSSLMDDLLTGKVRVPLNLYV